VKENLLGFFIDFDYRADLEFIEAQAYRFRLITATLGNRMNELITLLGEGYKVEKV
jgi:hypothetical protein